MNVARIRCLSERERPNKEGFFAMSKLHRISGHALACEETIYNFGAAGDFSPAASGGASRREQARRILR